MRSTASSRYAGLGTLALVRLSALACGFMLPPEVALARNERLSQQVQFDIPAQPLATGLVQFSKQARVQVVTSSVQLQEQQTPGVRGLLPIHRALDALLEETGLGFSLVGENTIAITAGAHSAAEGQTIQGEAAIGRSAVSLPSSPSNSSADASLDESDSSEAARTASQTPEILVTGSKVLNMDLKRTEDDPQPYVILDRRDIERSPASNIEDFLKTRLPMNTVGITNAQTSTAIAGNASRINLRGLGSNQTLILVDGRPLASLPLGSTPQQPNLHGIPLGAVERIEVLPATASGIYGGGATGGVINVVLRRNYDGMELTASYGNTFDSRSEITQVDFSAGFDLEGGKSNILLSGSYADAAELVTRDRELDERGRAAIMATNPGFFVGAANPPLGTMPNLRSVNGSPLFGPGTSNITSVPGGYVGGGGRAALQPNAGVYNLGLANSAQVGGGGDNGLLNGPTIKSLAATLRRRFGSRLDAFVEASASEVAGSSQTTLASSTFTISPAAPTNPFGQAIRVTVPVPQADGILRSASETRRVAGGLIADLKRGWRGEADYTWNQARTEYSLPGPLLPTAAIAVSNGALDVLRDVNLFPVDFTAHLGPPVRVTPFETVLEDAAIRVSGPIASLPADPVTVSILLEARDEEFSDGYQFFSPTQTFYFPRKSQRTNSAYLEARVPIVSERNRTTGVQELALQLAGRWDDYTIEGATNSVNILAPIVASIVRSKSEDSSVNPTVGLQYRPVQAVMFRGSYSTGFLPPAANQLVSAAPQTAGPGTLIDPLRGNSTPSNVQTTSGGNPNLSPEDSRSWSAGVVFAPRWIPGIRLSLDYVRIDKEDEIRSLFAQQIIDNEGILPSRIVRAPAPGGDPFGVGPIVAVDATALNLARTQVEAYDAALTYRVTTAAAGDFELSALATWQTHYKTQVLPTAAFVENVGVTSAFPLKFKANAGLMWDSRGFTIGWSANYFDSYLVADPTAASAQVVFLNQGSRRVSSQIYHDAFVSYRFPDVGQEGSQLLQGLEVQLGVQNVLDKSPPFDAGNSTHFYSPFGDPRLSSYRLSVKKRF